MTTAKQWVANQLNAKKSTGHFAIDFNKKSSKFYRIINEIPTIILIVVVFVVVFKPL